MQTTILKELLEEKLQQASRFISLKPMGVQSLQGCLMNVTKKNIEITTTNLNDFYKTKIPTKAKKTGVVIFDIKKVVEFLHFLPPGEITLSSKESTLEIMQNKTKGSFSLFNVEEFPDIPEAGGKEDVLRKEILEKLHMVLFSASKDETRPVLTGTMLSEGKKEGMNIVSTDGFRLSLLTVPSKKGKVHIIVPATILSEVIKMSEGRKCRYSTI